MEPLGLLREFFDSVKDNPRITPVHVSLYSTLISLLISNDGKNPLAVARTEVMQLARVSGRMTYYGIMNDLETFGFIRYRRSLNQFVKCQIYVIDPEERMSNVKTWWEGKEDRDELRNCNKRGSGKI